MERDKVDMLWVKLNSLFPDIQFTGELKQDNHIAFLDALVAREESGRLPTNVYRKPTTTERMLASDSNLPIRHKMPYIHTLWDGIETSCSS